MWSPSKAGAERAAKRRAGAHLSLNLWPFVGILVALLCAFMVSGAPPHHYLWFPVDHPRSAYAVRQPNALREDAMRISISRDGRVFFRNQPVAPEDLPDVIRDRVREGAEKKVYLAVDSRSRFADTEKAVDQIRSAGIYQISFLTQDPSGR